jgi:GABA(A) receptor-associated protein
MSALKTKPQRLVLSEKEQRNIATKFPGRIPVIVERHPGASADMPEITKSKFLVPRELTMSQFIYIVRRQINLAPDKALFLFVNNTLPTSSSFISEVHAAHKEPDGALHFVYTSESVFGTGIAAGG